MPDKKSQIKKELKELVKTGEFLLYKEGLQYNKIIEEEKEMLANNNDFLKFQKEHPDFKIAYQNWYSLSTRIIAKILPERLEEFKLLYINPKRKNDNIDFLTYTISDYLQGLTITRNGEVILKGIDSFISKHVQQVNILRSCNSVIDSKLNDIEGILQSELFDNELETAEDLLKKKHIRLAGALAGITLEVHLKKICSNHLITMRKANPTISDCNEELRKADIIDLITWRLIQRLGDIRNLSVHAKDREPTESEVQDLIIGCKKLIAELF
jgi:hypothetical protein